MTRKGLKIGMIISLTLFVITICSYYAFAFDIEKEINYELERGSTLENAFVELEKASGDYFIFYFDPEINLSTEFRLNANESFENVLGLILQLNELQTIKLSEQLYYVYPAAKREQYEKEIVIDFRVAGITTGKENIATIEREGSYQNVKENDRYMSFWVKEIKDSYVVFEYDDKEIVRYINEGGE
ncbi:MAG TPA: hypothetical protein VKY40_06970 [Halanaerobiales bacterium]|nr:hypothetical protein [Halanaerobiales bacterium]